MPALLDRQLLWVTGKGGVGRTTVCAALALVAARRGRRTIVCEVGAQERLPELFGRRGGAGAEVGLGDGLFSVSVDPQVALRQWLAKELPGPLSRFVGDSRTFGYFYAAAPGARELVTMGKLWDLTQPRRWDGRAQAYDLVVVDAPATGHAIGMLRTPRTFADIARVGPVHGQAERVSELLADPARSGFTAVTAPADMAVNETLDLQDRLRAAVGRELELVVANGLYPVRFAAQELAELAAADGAGPARAAVAAVTSQAARVGVQQVQLARLRGEARAPVAELPYVFAPELDLEAVRGLADELDAAVA